MVSRQASGSPSKVRPERGERVLKTRSQGMRTQCGRRRMRGHGVLTPPSGAASWTGPCSSADAGCASAPEGSRRGGTGRGGGGAPPCRGMDEEKRLDGRKRLPTAREGSLGDDGTGMGSEWEFSTGASGCGVDIGAPGGTWKRALDAMLPFHEAWMTCGPRRGRSSAMLLA